MTTELVEKALKAVGGIEASKRKRKEFRRDLAFIEKNREKLLKDYNERWIAAYKAEIIAHSKDYDDVLSQLERSGMPVGQIPIRYISKHKVFALYLWP